MSLYCAFTVSLPCPAQLSVAYVHVLGEAGDEASAFTFSVYLNKVIQQ